MKEKNGRTSVYATEVSTKFADPNHVFFEADITRRGMANRPERVVFLVSEGIRVIDSTKFAVGSDLDATRKGPFHSWSDALAGRVRGVKIWQEVAS